MRGVVVTKVRVEEKKNHTSEFLQKYLLKPFTGGILGYFSFFSLLMISKYLGFLIGNRASVQVDLTDIMLSFLGFAFIFVVKLRDTTKGKIS